MTRKNISSVIIVGVFIIIFVAIYFIAKNLTEEKFTLNPNYKVDTIEKYDVNQYIPVMINDEQMSRKYLLDYINSVNSDINNSYNLLNQEYRDKKFGSIDKYSEYIKSLNTLSNISVSRYATYELKGYKYYDLYDNNNNRYIFKTNGVMQYEVFFDDSTVKI